MELHHIRKNLKLLETEIKNRGYKDDIVILTILKTLKSLNKEIEKLTP